MSKLYFNYKTKNQMVFVFHNIKCHFFKVPFMYHKTTVLALFILFIFSNYCVLLYLLSGLPVPHLSNILWVVCGGMAISGPPAGAGTL